MAVTTWSGVAVAIQSALGSSQTVTGITKASPGVLTYSTGSDPSNGDYFLLAVQGMTQVDGRVFRVASVNTGAKTFQLEGEDTTAYDTFSSGTMYKITFGTTASTFTGLSASGGDFSFIDTTTIHQTVRSQVPGAANPATYTFTSFWDVSDAGLIALKAASDTKALRCVRFTFANGQKVLFSGYVGATLLPVGNAQDKVETQVVVTMYGRPTVYSS